jgi:dihydroxyacetone kinase-like protein
MNVRAQELVHYFKEVVEVMEKEKDYLCELDRKLGDGDHGVTMSIGWQAVNEKLNGELMEESDCGKVCITVGKTFLDAVGSSVGPLYATGFLRGAKAIKGKTELTDEDLAAFWAAFGNGVQERGQAKVGDKTMIDTLAPAVQALEENFAKSGNFIGAFKEGVAAGKAGMESTKELVSKIGRSSRLGERSIGGQDPGATSAYFILDTFLSYVEARSANVG